MWWFSETKRSEEEPPTTKTPVHSNWVRKKAVGKSDPKIQPYLQGKKMERWWSIVWDVPSCFVRFRWYHQEWWGGDSRSWIPTWIHIPDYNLTSLAATTSSATLGDYNISLCASRHAFRPVYWWFLIGVMIPPPPTSSQPSSPPILSSSHVPN